MAQVKLDKKDMMILFELDMDCRQSDAGIGRKVGLSREVVNYRIRNLIRRQVIERFYVIIDVARLGLISYKLYLQFQNLNREKEKEISSFFLNHPNYEWLALCSGGWDMIIGIWAENTHKFNEIFMEFSDRYGQYVMNKAFTITLGLPHYRKEYLVGKKVATEPSVYFGGKPKKEKLDSIDMAILRILANNARMPLVDIAKRVKSSARVVAYRIRELQRKKVIQAFRVTIDHKKIGMMFMKAFFFLQNISEKTMSRFISYCATHPNIVTVIQCAGPWDIEIEFEIEDHERFDRTMKEIRELFGGFIRGVNSVIVHEDYGGTRYYPGCYGKIDRIYKG